MNAIMTIAIKLSVDVTNKSSLTKKKQKGVKKRKNNQNTNKLNFFKRAAMFVFKTYRSTAWWRWQVHTKMCTRKILLKFYITATKSEVKEGAKHSPYFQGNEGLLRNNFHRTTVFKQCYFSPQNERILVCLNLRISSESSQKNLVHGLFYSLFCCWYIDIVPRQLPSTLHQLINKYPDFYGTFRIRQIWSYTAHAF